jgi:SOS-response transcriptional repressor LexA
VVPEEWASQKISWEEAPKKLDRVRSALRKNTGDVREHLLSAFSDALEAANYCHDSLSDSDPDNPISKGTLTDWIGFFKVFEKDTWNVYPEHSAVEVSEMEDLNDDITAISAASTEVLSALRELRAMPAQGWMPSERRSDVEKLKQLILALKPALKALQPPQRDADVYDLVSVRVGSRVAAGTLSTADESIVEVFPLNARLLEEGVFSLRKITGETTIDLPITNGDWIIVRRQSAAGDADLVAVDINGETTVRTFDQAGQAAILGTVAWVLSPVRGHRPGV